MTLSQRTVLIIVSTFIALLFILAVTSDVILLASFAKLERIVVADNIQKVRNEIDESYDELSALSHELETTVLAQGSSPLTKLPDVFLQSRHIDLIVCLSPDRQDMAAYLMNRVSRKHPADSAHVVSVIKENVMLARKSSAAPQYGLILVDGVPLQLVISQLPGNDRLLIVGRYLDTEEINRITALTEFVLELVPVSAKGNAADITAALAAVSRGDDNPVQVVNLDEVAGYSLFKDILGNPCLFAKITEERLLYNQGRASIIYVLSALFIAGGVFCCVMLFFIRKTILKRLAALTETVSMISTEGDISVRLPVSGREDELGALAFSINGMLDSLENSEKELRESEERYRMLFDRAPDAIIIIGLEDDEAGCIVAANHAAADLHGYTPEEICRLRIYDLNTSESNDIADNMISAIVAGEWLTAEVWHLKKDGTRFPIEIHAGLIKIAGKKYILGFDRDITQRKIAEETDRMHLERVRQLNDELSRKAVELAAANNELETFNYSVSHDMRGPLTRISGYCQLLLGDDCTLDSYAREYVTRIYESEMWLNEMIDALLEMAQLTLIEIISDRVNLSAIAEEVLKDLALASPERSVRSHVEPDCAVSGDPRLLKMVMTNLLGNAWKYSALKKDAYIEFGVEQTESGPAYFVRDNGDGFDMKDAGKLFRVFTRLHASSRFLGTGIGLATVQRIIFRHGGKIWAVAQPGAGATFFFTLQ
ncbi:MAG: PAS domain S-box protein [Desulfuromonadaceae bacterium]